MTSKWTSNEAVRYHHGFTTRKARDASATVHRYLGNREAQTAATQITAIHSAATMAASWSQSSATECGHNRPIRARGHMANSAWLCQNG
jgi:hypothetical protein